MSQSPLDVEKLWSEFCASFPEIAQAHDLSARFAYLAGYRAALEHCIPEPKLLFAQQEFEEAMFRIHVAIVDRKKRPRTDRPHSWN